MLWLFAVAVAVVRVRDRDGWDGWVLTSDRGGCGWVGVLGPGDGAYRLQHGQDACGRDGPTALERQLRDSLETALVPGMALRHATATAMPPQ